MRLRTLGGLALQDSDFTRPKPLLLLGYLALEGARDRHHVGELFFAQARDRMNSLRTTLKRLRHEAPGTLESDGDPLRASVECDAQTLLSNLDAGELELGTGRYAGPFLAGVQLPDWSVELEEWVYATREFIASRVRGALLTLAERDAARGEFGAAAKLAEKACWLEGAPDPEPEEFVRFGALFAAGQSPLIGRLREQAQGFEIDLNVSVEDAQKRLLGVAQHGLVTARPGLPVRGTSFVGRAVERPQIERALARSDVRLLALVGPGGIGKTRLALEVARYAAVNQEVVFISLEAMNALDRLPNAIAAALGLTLFDASDPFQALARLLAERSVLVVLDNIEHLLEDAEVLPQLLRDGPNLKLLVTSRERLGIEEEWVFSVGGLSVPLVGTPLEEALGFEGVQLFAQRAKRARLSFNLTADDLASVLRICELVGGSPLGLELAAAWVRLMPVAEIAIEISNNLDFLQAANRDVPARHHSLRAVFDQTWARLTDNERRVLSRLSVFRGGFTREAASEVSGASLASLSSLVDKSLVRVGENGRYDLHVLLHQFAHEMLAKNPEETQRAKNAHGAFFLAFSQRAADAIRQMTDEKRWSDRLDQELENIRAALTGWLEQGDTETALDCATVLRNFWARTGRMSEARMWFSKALSSSEKVNLQTRERALAVNGEMAMQMGDYTQAQRLLEESLTLSEARGYTAPLTLLHLGLTAQETLDYEVARGRFEQALAYFRELNLAQGIAASLNNLGRVLADSGDFEGALATYEESLRYKTEAGGDADSVLINLGDLHRRLGKPDLARAYFLKGLNGYVERGYRFHIPDVLEGLGELAAAQGDPGRASVLFGAASTQREAMNTPKPIFEQDQLKQGITAARVALGEDAFAVVWAEGRAMTLEQAVSFAINAVVHENS